MLGRNWIEVLVVVVAGAGERRTVRVGSLSTEALTDEMIWSNHQDTILEHLKVAEETWGVEFVHGRQVNNVWKDFLVVGETFKDLRFINAGTGDTVSNVVVETLNRVWKLAKEENQLLTDSPVILIYTDKDEHGGQYELEGHDHNFRAVRGRRGVTWPKKDKKNLPWDVTFIFSEACVDTTAHELGHLVADFPHNDRDPSNIMFVRRDCVIRGATDLQKKRFASSNYVHKGPKPKQGWRPGLRSRTKIF